MTLKAFVIRLMTSLGPALALAAAVMLMALWQGTVSMNGSDFLDWLLPWRILPDETMTMILSDIRWPRVLGAASTGAILAVGGLVFQAVLGNPLAEPYILGISGGAAIGAILAVVIGLAPVISSAAAFIGGIATLMLLFFISRRLAIYRHTGLLLSGVMINAFCGAVILFLVTLTMDWRIHQVLIWIMGDLSAFDRTRAHLLFAAALAGTALIWRHAQTLNLLMMGTDVARNLGTSTTRMTWRMLLIVSLMVSAAVSACGLIGFVGLVIPHTLRLIIGGDQRILVPVTAVAGSAYLVGCDLVARVLHPESLLPVGVITALIGAPVFILLLMRGPEKCH